MSASNWSKCPQCVKRGIEARKKRIQKVVEQYGKIDASMFVSKMNEAEKTVEVGETLREDYSQGVDSQGNYRVNYRCNCGACGFQFEHHYKEQVW